MSRGFQRRPGGSIFGKKTIFGSQRSYGSLSGPPPVAQPSAPNRQISICIDFGSLLNQFGIGLGSIWDRFGIRLEWVWGRFTFGWVRFGNGLGLVWNGFGVGWNRFGIGLGSVWGRFEVG